MIEEILLNDEKKLDKYLIHSIETIAHYLDMDTKFIYESDLKVDCSRGSQATIIDNCKMFNADHYINAIGGQELYSKEDFLKEGIELSFIKMGEIAYKQFDNEFISNLSIIDVMMFNSKDEIKEILKKYELV